MDSFGKPFIKGSHCEPSSQLSPYSNQCNPKRGLKYILDCTLFGIVRILVFIVVTAHGVPDKDGES